MIPVEAIQRVIEEIENRAIKNQQGYTETKDQWFSGTTHAYTESALLLQEVIAQHEKPSTCEPGDGA